MKMGANLPQFPHPFHGIHGKAYMMPRTKKETLVYQFTSEIRCKPKWYEKIKDDKIIAKWEKEILEELHNVLQNEEFEEYDDKDEECDGKEDDKEEATDEHEERSLTQICKKIFKKIIQELTTLSYSREGLLEISSVTGVWQADGLISEQVKKDLVKGVSVLENIPDEQKDWHPGTNKQVLDLVHPSLYCLVNNMSLVRTEGLNDLLEEVEKQGVAHSLMKIGCGTATTFVKPQDTDDESYNYRSNIYDETSLPGQQDNGYSFSEKYQWLPSEVLVRADGTAKFQSYINNLHPEEHAELYGTIEKIFTAFVPLFNKTLTNTCSEKVDLCGHRLQVIVKLANIILTPENPTYNGGTWHVEGMLNEHIIASGIYYYQSENISESKLKFRTTVHEPDDDEKYEYDYYFESPLNQYQGALITQEDRCIVFPNVMQHCVAPFELIDKQKPGVRKILVFFLVDPNHRIISTINVPPQQQLWYLKVLLKIRAFGNMPEELISHILDYLQTPMNYEAAVKYREELMSERKYFINENTNTYFERPCSLCEH